jgi:hypothetical protein
VAPDGFGDPAVDRRHRRLMLEMNVSGRKMMNPVCCAASGLRSTIPRQTPTQVNA